MDNKDFNLYDKVYELQEEFKNKFYCTPNSVIFPISLLPYIQKLTTVKFDNYYYWTGMRIIWTPVNDFKIIQVLRIIQE